MFIVMMLAACDQPPPADQPAPAAEDAAPLAIPVDAEPEKVGLALPVNPSLYDVMLVVGPIRGVNWIVPNAKELKQVRLDTPLPREDMTPDEAWALFLQAADGAGYRVAEKGKIAKVLKKR